MGIIISFCLWSAWQKFSFIIFFFLCLSSDMCSLIMSCNVLQCFISIFYSHIVAMYTIYVTLHFVSISIFNSACNIFLFYFSIFLSSLLSIPHTSNFHLLVLFLFFKFKFILFSFPWTIISFRFLSCLHAIRDGSEYIFLMYFISHSNS